MCQGIIMRANVSMGYTDYNNGVRGFFYRKYLNILKKKSCPGCKECEFLMSADYLGEIDVKWWPIRGFDKIVHGKLYKLTMEGDGEEFDYKVEEYKENDN